MLRKDKNKSQAIPTINGWVDKLSVPDKLTVVIKKDGKCSLDVVRGNIPSSTTISRQTAAELIAFGIGYTE